MTTVGNIRELESEAVHIIREGVALSDNPALLFSGGKDSLVLAHLAMKAFKPGKLPFPLIHIDTGHNFPETISFRDTFVRIHKLDLVIGLVEDCIANGRTNDNGGPRNKLQSISLLDTIKSHKFDLLFGGARRDEEKARAKERIFSLRNSQGSWTPEDQVIEIHALYSGLKKRKEHWRVFPLSNWTELDVWRYIQHHQIKVPSLYFAHWRDVKYIKGSWVSEHSFFKQEKIEVVKKRVRFRTIGDITCTGAFLSEAKDVSEIIVELEKLKTAERETRIDDKESATSMEDRKRQGYF